MGNMGNAATIEILHSRNHEERKYIAGLEWNFAWIGEELARAIYLWRCGYHYVDMAKQLKRREIEVLVLIASLQEDEAVEGRRGGIFGKGVKG